MSPPSDPSPATPQRAASGQGCSAPTPFAERLAAHVTRCGTGLLVGLDPRLEGLPEGLRPESTSSAEQAAACCERFCREIIDVVAPLVPAVKPQAAFFEQFGPAGMAALARVVDHARQRQLLVILDGKRNDIGSTAAAYAEAFLGRRGSGWGWDADALTVSPYLGDDSLTPFVDVACREGAGLFVLVKTSNPGGGVFQDLVADGRPLYRHVAEHIQALAAATRSASGYGAVGAVVGATYPEQLAELRAAMPEAWLLVPGFGAQGGSAADVAAAFDANGLGALVNSSRAINFAHTREPYRERYAPAHWQRAVEDATREAIEQLARR